MSRRIEGLDRRTRRQRAGLALIAALALGSATQAGAETPATTMAVVHSWVGQTLLMHVGRGHAVYVQSWRADGWVEYLDIQLSPDRMAESTWSRLPWQIRHHEVCLVMPGGSQNCWLPSRLKPGVPVPLEGRRHDAHGRPLDNWQGTMQWVPRP